MADRERTYGQYCPIATGLDVIGDRWVLLICRELSFGPSRFTDLRAALPGIAPNLLSDRLHSLQAAGLVETAELPPPAARTVYVLTDAGRDVIPVLRAVARLGVRYLADEPAPGMSAVRVASSLLVPWWRPEPGVELPPARLRLVLGDGGRDLADLAVDGRRLRVVPADDASKPDVTIETDAGALVRARKYGERLRATVTGRSATRRQLLAALSLDV